MRYIVFRENFIADAASSVKNRVQTNVGNMANAVNGAIRSVKGVGQGIADKATSAANTVTKAATTLGAKGLKAPSQAPLISDQAAAVKDSISKGVSGAASTVRNTGNKVLSQARRFIG